MFASWLRERVNRESKKPLSVRRPLHRRQPSLEILEDRCLLSVSIHEYAVTAGSQPYDITAGPDGNLWFTENAGNRIGEINPATHAIAEYRGITAGSEPYGITAGPDGNLWFTEYHGNRIGKIDPTTNAVTEYGIPTASRTSDSTAAHDGH